MGVNEGACGLAAPHPTGGDCCNDVGAPLPVRIACCVPLGADGGCEASSNSSDWSSCSCMGCKGRGPLGLRIMSGVTRGSNLMMGLQMTRPF